MKRGIVIFLALLALVAAAILWLVLQKRNGQPAAERGAAARAADVRPATGSPAAGSRAAGSRVDSNLLLTASSETEISLLLEQSDGRARLDASLAELMVPIPEGDLLEDWRWLVGEKAEIFRITVFGDMLVADPSGRLHWLDIGRGAYEKLPVYRDTWLPDFYFVAPEVIYAPILLELRAQDYALAEGEVYDWIKSPMVGGGYTKNNVQRGPIRAVVAFAGRLAQRKASGSPLPAEMAPASNAQFRVIVSAEGQYSMSPLEVDLPPGWTDAGKKGTAQECMDYIQKTWKDPRSKSQQDPEPAGGS